MATSLLANAHAGMGGPNIPPEDDGLVAECVAAAPGAPIHVLISDREAEHVPGCNMAFRKSALEEIGGFDERFRVAGDDVDVCWRLQESGRTLGFSAGAVVLHRRRDSVRRYLRQQYGYGKAEALLERKWPSRYNRAGSSRWSGRIYESPGAGPLRRPMVRYGTWGSSLFQSIYQPAPGTLSNLLRTPELLLLIAVLGVVSVLGAIWMPLLLAMPLFLVGVAADRRGERWPAAGRRTGRLPARSGIETTIRRLLTAAALLPAADGEARRAAPQRPVALAPPAPSRPDLAASADGRGLERNLVGPPGPCPGPPGCPGGERRPRPQRRALRPLGPGPARRPARRGQDPHRGGGARLRQAAASREGLAAGLRLGAHVSPWLSSP